MKQLVVENHNDEDIATFVETLINKKKIVAIDLITCFNGCMMTVEKETTKEELLRYYFDNVDFSQFKGI